MIVNLWMALDDRARPNANPQDEDGPGHSAFRALGDPSVRSIFRKDNPNGPRDYELWSLYYEVADGNDLRDIRNALNADFPGQIRTIGAWWWDGSQVMNPGGQQPLFPLHTSILEYMPDIDDVGTRPTAPSDVNLGLGQAPRQF